MHKHKSTNPKGLTPLQNGLQWPTEQLQSGCNNRAVVAGSSVSVAERKKLLKTGCASMLMRLLGNVCNYFALAFVRRIING